jgi:hydrogenase-4 component E
MPAWVDGALVLLALTSLLLLGSSRLVLCIRIVAFQGLLLGGLTLAAHAHALSFRTLLLAAGVTALKGMGFPWLLARVLRAAEVRREVEPFVSYNASILIGTVTLAGSLWLSARLPLPTPPISALVVPVSLFATLAGLFLIISRRKALTQVLGYLVLENGIYVFGVGLVQGTPMVVELGVLLDVFVAVFVMGIAIFHINREFDHIDADRLAALRDWVS